MAYRPAKAYRPSMNLPSFRAACIAPFVAVALAACTSSPVTAASGDTTDAYRNVRECKRIPGEMGGDCSIEETRSASLDQLRALGGGMTVSCKFSDHPLDGTYMQTCVEQVQSLAEELSCKWSAELAPIDTRQLRYDWSGYDEIHLMLDDGGVVVGFWWGQTTLPLRWRDAASAAQPPLR
jgi:hypothetical protein